MTTINDFSLDFLLDNKIFENYKMQISSMESWGILRRDLISALGLQRAKKFLIQNGWNSGKHEAQMLKDAIHWEDKHDWLIAGTKLHVMTGRVTSYPETFYVDMEKGEFDVSGYWLDSYEAEQHSEHFHPAHEPICYFLVGYASGYTSECMGKTIIFKEITCKGKQDAYCSYVGKTLESWGDEIEEDLLFFRDTDMSDELDRMYRIVEDEKENLKLGSILNRRLSEAMLEGKGLEDFARIFAELTKSSVKIENKHFNELAKYCNMPGLDEDLSASFQKDNKTINELIKGTLTKPIQNKALKLVTTPINIKGDNFGFITVAVRWQKEKAIIDLIERLSESSALFIQNKRIAIETEEKVTGHLVDQLLNNETDDISEIQYQLNLLGYDLSKEYAVISIDVGYDQQDKNSLQLSETILKQLITEDTSKFGHENILSTLKNGKADVLISSEILENNQMTINSYAKSVFDRVNKKKVPVFIGVSDFTKELSDFKKMATESEKAKELGKARGKSTSIVFSKELGHLSLLLNARSPTELKNFAIHKLEPIIKYDETNNSSLLDTLYNYSQNDFNLHKTARTIHISISGMRYRVQKIEELLKQELTDSDLRFEIKLSLSILYVFGEIDL